MNGEIVDNNHKAANGWVLAVSISTLMYIILHNYEPSYAPFAPPWWFNLVQLGLFGPLLYFLYRRKNWAHIGLAVICILMALMMIVLTPILYWDIMTRTDVLVLIPMFLCMLFNMIMLWYNKPLFNNIKESQ